MGRKEKIIKGKLFENNCDRLGTLIDKDPLFGELIYGLGKF